MFGVEFIDQKLKIDDPVGAIGVHFVNGALGTVLTGLFATDGGLFYGGGFGFLGVQMLGVLAVCAWVGVAITLVFFLLKKTIGLRVSREEEIDGLDIHEHGLISAYADFAPMSLGMVSPEVQETVEGAVPAKSADEAVPVVETTTVTAAPASGPRISKVVILLPQSRFDALKEALNAVAVKVLKDYGVEKSVRFLEDTLGYDVDNEKKILEEEGEDRTLSNIASGYLAEGEDRILSNIALGYLENGVTVSKMADAYQVFINEGKDTPLCAVKEIEKSGETYWTPQQKESEVFSEDTAYNIMNRMLREVVTDGTGISAQVTGLDVCGKTGTSEYGDHWFVGMIPGNVCAVWYKSDKDMDAETADAARICKGVFEKIGADASEQYSIPTGVKEEVYCKKSGLLAGEQCQETGIGYYKEGTFSKLCEECR